MDSWLIFIYTNRSLFANYILKTGKNSILMNMEWVKQFNAKKCRIKNCFIKLSWNYFKFHLCD